MNTVDRVYKVLSRFNPFGVVIHKESRLIGDLGLDSLTMVEFLAELDMAKIDLERINILIQKQLLGRL